MKKTQSKTVLADDGYALACKFFESDKEKAPLIVVASATGVPQRYYERFALSMVAKGFSVITFDYRGIGGSRDGSLRRFKANFVDWARLDLKAVIDFAVEKHEVMVVGHSYAGHAYGLLPNANETLGFCCFGSGSGWYGYMPKREARRAKLLWNFLGPVLTRIYGYLPSKLIGLGENLPLGVYRQWKKWCAFPDYFFEDKEVSEEFSASFSNVTVPVQTVNALDDAWASPKSANALFRHYDKSSVTFMNIDPSEHGLISIEHMGYFHSSCLELTTGIVLDFWEEQVKNNVQTEGS